MKLNCFIAILSFVTIQTFGQQQNNMAVARDSNMVKQLFFSGLREKLMENYSAATGYFNKVLAIDANNDATYFELANLNLKQNKLIDAESAIKKAIAIQSNNEWYFVLLSDVYKRNGKINELIGVFAQLIKLNPNNADYYYDKANAESFANKIDAATKTYQEIEEKFGSSAELIQARQRLLVQKDGKLSDKELEKLIAENPTEAKNYLYLSDVLLQKGDEQGALNLLKKAQAIEADNFELQLALADVYRSLKKDAEAFLALKSAFNNSAMPINQKVKIVVMMFPSFNRPEVLNQAQELAQIAAIIHPQEPKVLALYADVLCQQGKYKEAKVLYLETLKLTKQVYAVWEQTINIQNILGEYQEALKTGDEALSFYPNQASLHYYVAFAQYKTGKNTEAMQSINDVLILGSDNKELLAQAYALQGDIFINEKKFSAANKAYDKALEVQPNNYLMMNNYAYYLTLRDEDLPKAATMAEKAANALPQSASVADTYAFVLFRLQKYNEAQLWIEKAVKISNGKNALYLERYGDILYLKGEKEQAIVQWQKAKEAGGNSEMLNKKINEKKYFK